MNIVPSFEQGKLQQNGIEAVSETNLFFLVTFNHNRMVCNCDITDNDKISSYIGGTEKCLVYFLYI